MGMGLLKIGGIFTEHQLQVDRQPKYTRTLRVAYTRFVRGYILRIKIRRRKKGKKTFAEI